jgi:hypothetical protein
MEPDERRKGRIVIYLSPDLRRRLRIERAETDRPMSAIAEEALAAWFAARDSRVPTQPA